MKDLITIKCAVCGEEYLMSEIFIPEPFFGKQTEIIKDSSGHINYYLGTEPDMDEDYVCDNCGSHLKVHANITFDVTAVSDEFEEEYVTKINKPKKIMLSEDPIF